MMPATSPPLPYDLYNSNGGRVISDFSVHRGHPQATSSDDFINALESGIFLPVQETVSSSYFTPLPNPSFGTHST